MKKQELTNGNEAINRLGITETRLNPVIEHMIAAACETFDYKPPFFLNFTSRFKSPKKGLTVTIADQAGIIYIWDEVRDLTEVLSHELAHYFASSDIFAGRAEPEESHSDTFYSWYIQLKEFFS